MTNNFASQAIMNGGCIRPLLLPNDVTNGTAIFNPSVYNDNGNLILCLRHCQYTFYHSEKKKFEHEYGPLLYLNPENDLTLTTTNYFCQLNSDLMVEKYYKVDTSSLDVKPIWEFVGLEDARLFRWDGKLYMSGVRRDTTPNGVGRMELSEIQLIDGGVKEVSRWRIPAPPPDNTYCEKNWMPVSDLPYHYVKWSNPTEVVKVDPIKKTCETVFMGQYVQKPYDYRGSSHVINVGEFRVALTHTVDLFTSEAGKKDAVYRHAFIVWDLNWNLIKYTNQFSFMNADVEFCCGMTEYNGNILISFGVQDNAAYILSVTPKFIEDFINAN